MGLDKCKIVWKQLLFIEIIKIFVILWIDNSYVIINTLVGILLNYNSASPL